MKKILMIAAALISAVSVTASAESISMKYNTASACIQCSGSFDSSYVKLIVVPYGTDTAALDDAIINSSKGIIMKSAEIQSGKKLSDTIAFGADFPNGRYMLYAINENAVLKKVFIKCDAVSLSDFVKKLNASDKSSRNMLIKSECPLLTDSSEHADCIAKRLAALMPENGYTDDGFYEEYLVSLGAAELESDKISFEDMLMMYDAESEIYDDYMSRTENIKGSIADYAETVGLSGESLESIYGDALYTSLCRYAKASAGLQKNVTEHFAKTGKNLSDYNTFSEYRKAQVFEKMYALRSGFTSPAAIEKAFDTALAEVKAEIAKQGQDGGTGSGGTGGGGSSSSGGSSGKAFGSTPAKTDTKVQLTDIDGHWCADIITKMYESGNISGYEDNTFRPDSKITRAEFVKLTVSALNLPIVSGHCFEDVSMSAWYSGYAVTAYKNGLVTGTDDNMFMPDKNITRQDAAVIIYRAAKKLGINTEGAAVFEDNDAAADYALAAIGALSAKGIINGDGGKFFPQNDITRAEAAAMLYRLNNSR